MGTATDSTGGSSARAARSSQGSQAAASSSAYAVRSQRCEQQVRIHKVQSGPPARRLPGEAKRRARAYRPAPASVSASHVNSARHNAGRNQQKEHRAQKPGERGIEHKARLARVEGRGICPPWQKIPVPHLRGRVHPALHMKAEIMSAGGTVPQKGYHHQQRQQRQQQNRPLGSPGALAPDLLLRSDSSRLKAPTL